MEKPARSQNTRHGCRLRPLGRNRRRSGSDERYPDGTVLIPADSPDASTLMSRAIADGKTIAIVFPDGSEEPKVAALKADIETRIELAELAREAGFDPAEFGL